MFVVTVKNADGNVQTWFYTEYTQFIADTFCPDIEIIKIVRTD